MKILIADDNEDSRLILKKTLEPTGHSVEAASNGAEALKMVKESPPDMVISDILMPKMDGFVLCREIKSNERLRKIPFVFYTATYIEPEDEKLALGLGASRFIVKPIEADEFLKIINEVLQEFREERLPVPESLREEPAELFKMYEKSLVKKLNKKVEELERERKTLRESEEKFRLFFDNISEIIYSLDHNLRVTSISPSVERILRYTPEELIGKSIQELSILAPEYLERALLDAMRVLAGERIDLAEYMFIAKDGTRKFGEISGAPLWREGKVMAIISVARDITERKHLEETIKEERDFSKMIIETADVLIMGLDLNGKILLFNKKAEEVTGYHREELLKKNVFERMNIKDEEFRTLVERILSGDSLTPRDVQFISKTGKELIIHSRGTPLKDRNGTIIGVLGIGLDVTERRKMEQTIRQSEKLRALGELAGGVAHDFNNILAAILGRAQLLKMGIAPPPGIEEKRASALELRKGLDIIERAAKDGAETVRRIQAFSRKRTDDSLFTEIDINELLEHSLEFTKVRWKGEAETKGIHFTIQKEFSSLPLVTGSSSELREVFVNLINNAIDAMPQGGKITIKTFRKDNDLAIVIEDTGAGIPKAIRDRIFEPFFTTKGPQSTGLGMSVSYGIIDRHRGTISVESEEGQGATFTITLPIAEERLEEEKIHTRMAEQKKATILVIEDEEHISALLSDILIKGGHEVETASDGSKGIETFKKKAFDLVFTDLNMVGISGWEVAEKVKSINGRVPVVLITGWNIKLEEKKIKDKWVDLVIQKPFEVDQVLKVVQQGVILREQFKKV